MATYSPRRTLSQGGIPNTERVSTDFHFVDNVKFYEDLKAFLIRRTADIEAGLPIPQIPNSIGGVFIAIAEFESRKHNFSGYSYKDEMKSDAVTNMCTYVHKFDWANKTNPFAYFKQAAFNSFILRIKKEKKQTLVKASVAGAMGTLLDDIALELQDLDSYHANASTELLQLRASDVIAKHEEATRLRKEKYPPPKTVEEIMHDAEVIYDQEYDV